MKAHAYYWFSLILYEGDTDGLRTRSTLLRCQQMEGRAVRIFCYHLKYG